MLMLNNIFSRILSTYDYSEYDKSLTEIEKEFARQPQKTTDRVDELVKRINKTVDKTYYRMAGEKSYEELYKLPFPALRVKKDDVRGVLEFSVKYNIPQLSRIMSKEMLSDMLETMAGYESQTAFVKGMQEYFDITDSRLTREFKYLYRALKAEKFKTNANKLEYKFGTAESFIVKNTSECLYNYFNHCIDKTEDNIEWNESTEDSTKDVVSGVTLA